jgi:hypothetical protein
MPCCGKKRLALGPMNPEAASAARDATGNHNQSGPSAGAAARETQFEYRGGRVLTVTGQGTGYQYRFVGHGARLWVDARDRASLAAVPHLREVRG